MPTSTYTPIATATGTGSSGTISFTSIPSTYTDLVIVQTGGGASGSPILQGRFNNDSGSNYSRTWIIGNGTGVSTSRDTSNTVFLFGLAESNTNSIIHIMNYANTTTYKTVLNRNNPTSSFAGAVVSLWRSTAAVNRVDFILDSGNFATTATITLYGIKAGS